MTAKKTSDSNLKKSAPKKTASSNLKKEAAKPAPKIEENLVLIGFMGVGKGAVARELAAKTGLFAVDCDDMIESFANKKIKKIFASEGEAAFRKIEGALALFLENSLKGAIISTGGGFFAVPNLNKIGRVIYLKTSFEGILKRIKSAKNADKKLAKRPLLSNLKKAKELFNEREDKYAAKADIIIDCEGKSEKKIAEEILKKISNLNAPKKASLKKASEPKNAANSNLKNGAKKDVKKGAKSAQKSAPTPVKKSAMPVKTNKKGSAK